jgi:uncharacterized FlaG/YvyC family protein
MKTDRTAAQNQMAYTGKEPRKSEPKPPETASAKKEPIPAYALKSQRIELKEPIQKPLESVKKHIAENIQWREMRFYRHEADGQYFVDIIDKATGAVLRTVPEPEFVKLATEFKHLAGLNLDISG